MVSFKHSSHTPPCPALTAVAVHAAGTVKDAAPRTPLLRFQFAHGCLHGHLLAGEESFAVEWDKQDDTVW